LGYYEGNTEQIFSCSKCRWIAPFGRATEPNGTVVDWCTICGSEVLAFVLDPPVTISIDDMIINSYACWDIIDPESRTYREIYRRCFDTRNEILTYLETE